MKFVINLSFLVLLQLVYACNNIDNEKAKSLNIQCDSANINAIYLEALDFNATKVDIENNVSHKLDSLLKETSSYCLENDTIIGLATCLIFEKQNIYLLEHIDSSKKDGFNLSDINKESGIGKLTQAFIKRIKLPFVDIEFIGISQVYLYVDSKDYLQSNTTLRQLHLRLLQLRKEKKLTVKVNGVEK